MAKSKKKSVFRTSSGERSVVARVLAIIGVLIIIAALIVTMLPAYLFADEGVIIIGDNQLNPDGTLPLVIDDADILSDSEEAELRDGLNSFRESNDFDIVVLTVYSLNGMDVVEYADRFYEENGYGGGADHDGALILVSTENRDWTMTTAGYGNTAITDYSLDLIEERVLPELSAGDYLNAFEFFADDCATLVMEAKAGNIVDVEEEAEEPALGDDDPFPEGVPNGFGGRDSNYPVATNVGIAGVVGVIVSWFTNSRKKAKLKTVRFKNQAKDYVRKDSLSLTENRDRFLFATTRVTPISTGNHGGGNQSNGNGPGTVHQGLSSPAGFGHGGTTVHHTPGGNLHGGGHSGKF